MHLLRSHQQIRKQCLAKLHYGLLVQENGGFTLANKKAELGPSSFKVSGGVAFLAISISIIINPSLVKKKMQNWEGSNSKKYKSLGRTCLLSLSNVYTVYTCMPQNIDKNI